MTAAAAGQSRHAHGKPPAQVCGARPFKRLGRVVLLLALAVFGFAAASAANAGPAAEFRRGIGVGAMAWAAIEPGAGGDFAFPPFVGPSYTLTLPELQTLQHTGFDFVRLAVDPGPFLQFRGARRSAVDGLLVERVKLILESGLSVVVDFHPSDMHPAYTAQQLTADRKAPLFQSYLGLVERIAGLLGSLHSDRVALELMNEPPVSPSDWQPMLDTAYAAARRGSPGLVLVVEGGREASPAALTAMNTALFSADPAVVYAFHYYDPYQFTHQGASWNAARYLADVPYPARARPFDNSLTATAALIASTDLPAARKALAYQDAQARLEDYRTSGFDASTIAADFARIARWAQSRGIPADRVMLGEFGAIRGTPQRAAERAQWFHDVTQAAQANGFGWAVWTYHGGSFALAQDETGRQIDPDIAKALGLATPAPQHADAVPHAAAALP